MNAEKEIFSADAIRAELAKMAKHRRETRSAEDAVKLARAADQIMRLQFAIAWNRDSFLERYSEADLIELEEGLRNSAKILAIELGIEEEDECPLK